MEEASQTLINFKMLHPGCVIKSVYIVQYIHTSCLHERNICNHIHLEEPPQTEYFIKFMFLLQPSNHLTT